MRATDFFTDPPNEPWSTERWAPSGRLDEDLLHSLQLGTSPNHSDASAAAGLMDLVQDELEAYGTSGGEQLTNAQMALAILVLEALTRRLGMPVALPFRDFTRFRSYWNRNGAHGSYQARRDMLEELLEPPRRQLRELELGRPAIPPAALSNLRDPAAIQEQLGRIQRAILDDPALAIGSAKEIVESTAKAVLLERGLPLDPRDDLPALVSKSQRALSLHPSKDTPGPDGTDAVRRILGGLITVTTGLSELRNRGYGTGHGPAGRRVGLRPRHAHLAVNAAVTWCQLMLDTLADPDAPWRSSSPD